jgi:glutamyl-tRNA synthetase
MEKSKKQKRTESVEVVLPNATVGKVVVRFGASGFLPAAVLGR